MMHNMHYERGQLVPNRMNPTRRKVLDLLGEAMKRHMERSELGDLTHLMEARRLNQEFIDRSRGKGRV